jgi:transposase
MAAKPSAARRLRAVQLVASGLSQAEAARRVGVSREAVRRWCAAAADGGMEALAPRTGTPGRPEAFSDGELRAWVAEANRRWPKGWTPRDLAAVAAERGVAVNRNTLRRRLNTSRG